MAALRYFFSLLMIPVSFIIAGASVLAFLAAWISPAESGLITRAALVMPAILLANLVMVIYWIIRKKWWVVVPLAAILLNTGYLTSIFQVSFSTPTIPEGATTLRIATYNVGNFRSWAKQDTYYPIAELFREEKVDIACFQEYSERPKLKADSLSKILHLPYHAVEYLPASTTNGSAIYSKFPILRHGQLPFTSTSNDAMWADIQVGQQIIRVVSCHLQTTNFSRKRRQLKTTDLENATPGQLASLYNDISSTLVSNSILRAGQADLVRQLADTTALPLIVCGDFNDPPSAYTYYRMKGPLKDSFRSRGNGYGYTFRGIHRLLRIDYILYSPQFDCISYFSEEQEWSDHNPIICEFCLL